MFRAGLALLQGPSLWVRGVRREAIIPEVQAFFKSTYGTEIKFKPVVDPMGRFKGCGLVIFAEKVPREQIFEICRDLPHVPFMGIRMRGMPLRGQKPADTRLPYPVERKKVFT
eukprot:RCo004032